MSISRVLFGYHLLSSPPLQCSYLKYELITEFIDKVPIDQHENITAMHIKKRAFDRHKFYNGKSLRLHSLQRAIRSLGISKTILGFHNQLGIQELTESYYAYGYIIEDLWFILKSFFNF